MSARLQRLEDRADIIELIAKYGPIVDAGEGRLLGELWTKTGRYEIGDDFAFEAGDLAGLTELPTHQAYLAAGCAHVLTTPTVQLSGDRAIAVNHSVVLVRAGEHWVADRVSANEWHFTRTVLGWRVELRQNRLLNGDVVARGLLAPPALRG